MKHILLGGSGGAASIGFTRCLRKMKEKVYIVGTDCNLLMLPFSESNVNYLVPKAMEGEYINAVNEIILKENIEFMHTQPDAEVMVVSKNRKKINTNLFLPSHRTIEIFQDKFKSFNYWMHAGITLPKTLLLRKEKDLEQAFAKLEVPFWIRATKGAGGRGSLIVKDINQAKAWIDYWKGWGNFIASELLPKRLVTWQSLWKDGELVCAQGRERLTWGLSHTSATGVTGVTGVARIIARKDLDEIAEKAILAVDKKPHGIFGVDLKENKQGVPCPTEVNIGRFFTTIQFFAELGLNMPEIYLKLAYRETIPLIDKKYNPLPEGYYWLRTIDSKPLLLKESDFKRITKNKVDTRGALKPDHSVEYRV